MIEKGRDIFSACGGGGGNPVAKEAFKLSERWETLAQKAMERTAILEGSIVEAQEWEYKLIAVQDWLQDRDVVLSSNLEHDLTAESLPDLEQVNLTHLLKIFWFFFKLTKRRVYPYECK